MSKKEGGNVTKNSFQYLTYRCAELSESIYHIQENEADQYTPPSGFELVLHHGGTPQACRVANWMILTSDGGSHVYIAFRGSITVMDWLVNISAVTSEHRIQPNVEVHGGIFNEIDKEYRYIKEALIELMINNPDCFESLAITGHSKGGALAQLFMDKLFHDADFSFFFEKFLRINCIVFAAAMVYWFKDPSGGAEVACKSYIHNFIIHGDPVPILQLLLAINKKAVLSLLEREASKHSIFGKTLVGAANFNKIMGDTAPFLTSYRPVGQIYVAKVSNVLDLSGVEFDQLPPNFNAWSSWSCVLEDALMVDRHEIQLHHKLTQYAYQAYLENMIGSPKDLRLHSRGLFVRNETDEDVLVVLSQVTPLHWARVPRKSTRYIWSGRVWFKVAATIYDPEKEPTQTGVGLTIGGAILGTAATIAAAPLLITLDATLGGLYLLGGLFYAGSTVARGASSAIYDATAAGVAEKYFINGVFADGRTVLVTNARFRGKPTIYLEIELVETESVLNTPFTKSELA